MKKIKWTELIISIVGTELVGALSALISGGYSEYYSQLVQPAFAPPSAVFPVVWAVLYAVMGFSAYLVYFSESPQRKNALIIYITQLFINFSWSIVFFRFRALLPAAAVAVLLVIAVAAMIIIFGKVNKTASRVNIPYLLWSIFAAYLAVGFYVLN
ncbi:MAG: tryptophan-rich sensory protein [Ruminococcus sp.]|nr:tryptophan-rich sensory protein [Ruminococcus sp.]